jgi:hypothetical protein
MLLEKGERDKRPEKMHNEDLHDSFVCFWRDSLQWAMAFSFTRFLDHTQRRTTLGKTALDE